MIEAKKIDKDLDWLRQVSKDVDLSSDDISEDIKILEDYCLEHEVFAMAAVQLGIPKRLVYIKNTDLDKVDDEEWNEATILVNPVIKKREGLTQYWEACASCLDNCGRVLRPYKIDLEYFDNIETAQTILKEGGVDGVLEIVKTNDTPPIKGFMYYGEQEIPGSVQEEIKNQLTQEQRNLLVELAKIPAWMVILIIAREFIISGFRTIAADNGVVIAASYWGKFKTTFQMIAVCLLIADIQAIALVTQIVLWIAVILTVVSLVDYLVKNKDVMKDK